jgi:hypothetical protein
MRIVDGQLYMCAWQGLCPCSRDGRTALGNVDDGVKSSPVEFFDILWGKIIFPVEIELVTVG